MRQTLLCTTVYYIQSLIDPIYMKYVKQTHGIKEEFNSSYDAKKTIKQLNHEDIFWYWENYSPDIVSDLYAAGRVE